ncbi:MAG: hypothetical protein HZA09_00250 [Nitrospirae bacterium]|nr:hypothetical protein [Nitrospirota bacterium]
MTEPMTDAALLFKIATAILTDIGKRGLANLVKEAYIAKAIEATAKEFPDIEGLDFTLGMFGVRS